MIASTEFRVLVASLLAHSHLSTMKGDACRRGLFRHQRNHRDRLLQLVWTFQLWSGVLAAKKEEERMGDDQLEEK